MCTQVTLMWKHRTWMLAYSMHVPSLQVMLMIHCHQSDGQFCFLLSAHCDSHLAYCHLLTVLAVILCGSVQKCTRLLWWKIGQQPAVQLTVCCGVKLPQLAPMPVEGSWDWADDSSCEDACTTADLSSRQHISAYSQPVSFIQCCIDTYLLEIFVGILYT